MAPKHQLAGRAHVLVIEDDKSCGRMYMRALTRAGHEVSLAQDGKRGLEIVQKRRPDAVLLDLNLPDVNGFMVMDILRADPRTADIPVLVMTGEHDPAELLKTASSRYNARDFLYKPFSMEELRLRIGGALAGREKTRPEPEIAAGTVLRRGPLTLDLVRQEVHACGETRKLGHGQSGLLYELMRRRGPVGSKDLLRHVWHGGENRNTVSMAAGRLREALLDFAGVEVRASRSGYELVIRGESAEKNSEAPPSRDHPMFTRRD